MRPDDGEFALWVVADAIEDGTYCPVVTFGPDRSWPLYAGATEYAEAVTEVAVAAEHDAAVVAMLVDVVGMPLPMVATLVQELRGRRPEHVEPLDGMRITAAVNHAGKPFVTIEVKGCEPMQTAPYRLRKHGADVLAVKASITLDRTLRAALVDPFGLDDQTARGMVGELAGYIPTEAAQDE